MVAPEHSDEVSEGSDEESDKDSEAAKAAYMTTRKNFKKHALSLEESIEEMNYLIGFRHVDVRTVLNLLCSNGMYWESPDKVEWKDLPVAINRDAFVTLVNVLSHLVLGKVKSEDPDAELVNLLFDVPAIRAKAC